MKRKLLLTMLCVVSALGMRAQTDVTSTYLVNPSFETLKASDGTTDVTVKTTLSKGLYGWTVPSMSNYQVESEESGSSSGFVNGNGVAASAGTYYYFNRQGWANLSSELSTTTSTSVPAGIYYLSFDYKAADYSNNNNASKNGTTIGITVTDASSNTLATLSAVKRAYSITNGSSSPGTDSYMYDAPWTEMGIVFKVTEASVLTFAVQQNMVNSGRSDIMYDNFQLFDITDATNIDVSGLIANPSFEAANTNAWTVTSSSDTGARSASNDTYAATGSDGKYLFNTWWKGNPLTQTIASLPNGKYKLTASVSSNGATIYLKGNDGHNNGTETGGTYPSSDTFQDATYTFDVTDGTATIGVVGGADGTAGEHKEYVEDGYWWYKADNFRLTLVSPAISYVAEELPDGGAMTADSWYYFDIAVDGNYNLTASSDIDDIVYTTNGGILIENQSDVTDKFSGTENVPLTAGRFYVKSSSAQTFTVEAASYSYVLGAATLSAADGSYTQAQTFTVTFPSAGSNDPGATLTLVEGSKATVNGAEVALTAITKGFSLDLGTLTTNTDYVISIPASVYGYSGQSMNEAISLTIHTPVAFDDVYCLYDANHKLFLGRGNAYGTEASADKYGIPFNLRTNTSNVSSIEFVDWTGVYLFLTGTAIYTDNNSTGWNLVPTTDGYYLKTSDGTYYATHASGGYGEYVYATTDEASATVWTLKTAAERDAIVDAYPTDNINNVITASGISTTAANFETYLSTNYTTVDYTSAIGTATFSGSVGDWTWNQARSHDKQPAYGTDFAEVWCATGNYTQTIAASNVPAGIYKLTVDGYERRATVDKSNELGAAGYNLVSSYFAANEEQVRLTDWYATSSKPGSTSAAVTAFNNGEATNTLYIYLDGSTDLTLKLAKPNYVWDCWTIFNNFTLTRYIPNQSVTITSAGWATLYTPRALDFSEVSGLKAYTAAIDGTTVTLTEVDDVPANTGVVLKGAPNTYSIPVAASSSTAQGELQGSATAATPCTVENSMYILGVEGGIAQFFPVETSTSVPAGKAYLPASAAAGVLNIVFEDGEATGIAAPEAANADEDGVIYNLNGQIVTSDYKGVVIKNGKKYFNK